LSVSAEWSFRSPIGGDTSGDVDIPATAEQELSATVLRVFSEAYESVLYPSMFDPP
jgi:hypothetical protein